MRPAKTVVGLWLRTSAASSVGIEITPRGRSETSSTTKCRIPRLSIATAAAAGVVEAGVQYGRTVRDGGHFVVRVTSHCPRSSQIVFGDDS